MRFKARRLTRAEKQFAKHAMSLAEQLAVTTASTFRFYTELAPDGRILTAEEASSAREWLEVGAVQLRRLYAEADVAFLAELGQRVGKDRDLRPTISTLLMLQRNLALALSDDLARRKLAIPSRKAGELFLPIYQFWRDA